MATAFPSVQVASMVASMSMEDGVFHFIDSMFDLYQKEKNLFFWSYLERTLNTLYGCWGSPGPGNYVKNTISQISVKKERGLSGGCVWTVFKPKNDIKMYMRL